MLNNCILMGRLTHAPEMRTTGNGTNVLSFTLAVERSYQAKGEEKKADFIDCVAWRNNADFIARYFGKGDMIAVIGELQTRTYTDKDDNKRKAVEIVVSSASFCGGKNNGGNANETAEPVVTAYSNGSNADFIEISGDDDIPFN